MTTPSPSSPTTPQSTAPDTVSNSRASDPRHGLWQPGGTLVCVGAVCVVCGGLVAAMTGPLKLAEGSWLAAYLVLVGGAAQYAIGRAPALLGARPMSARAGWTLLASWNLGNAAVIGGTLSSVPILVDTGAALLTVGLAIAWRTARSPSTTIQARGLRLAYWAYRSLLLVLLVSIPIGAALAHLRGAT